LFSYSQNYKSELFVFSYGRSSTNELTVALFSAADERFSLQRAYSENKILGKIKTEIHTNVQNSIRLMY